MVILLTALGLLALSCGSDTAAGGGEGLPTPRPAPTVEGKVIELAPPQIRAETVFVGVPITDVIEVRVLPGIDKPVAATVPPSVSVASLDQIVETPDGLIWWQVQAGDFQGWVQPTLAYRGPAEDITDQVLATLSADDEFSSAEEVTAVVTQRIAALEGALELVTVSRTEIEGTNSATITTDLLGFEDDAQLGLRIIVASGANSGWRPASVVQAPLCARGITPQGLCL